MFEFVPLGCLFEKNWNHACEREGENCPDRNKVKGTHHIIWEGSTLNFYKPHLITGNTPVKGAIFPTVRWRLQEGVAILRDSLDHDAIGPLNHPQKKCSLESNMSS